VVKIETVAYQEMSLD